MKPYSKAIILNKYTYYIMLVIHFYIVSCLLLIVMLKLLFFVLSHLFQFRNHYLETN